MIEGRGGGILVTRCHGGGRGAEVAGWARGAGGPETWRAGAPGRFSGVLGMLWGSSAGGVAGARRIRGEVGLRHNCELGSPGCESWSYGARAQSVRFLALQRAEWLRSVARIVRHFSL